MRSQIDIGLQQAEALTQKRGMMVCANERTARDNLAGLMRRVLQDACERFVNVCMDDVHHLAIST